MEGFQEKGEPEAWDMALGTVRGYRWWNVCMYFVVQGSMYDRYTGSSFDFRREFWHSPWQPNYRRSCVTGMHGGAWSLGLLNKSRWHEARCEANAAVAHLNSGIPAKLPSHPVPDPDCACGFWAYWDELTTENFNNTPFARYDRDYGYSVSVPLGGRVEGAGRTIIGEKGFRSERVRITDLAMAIDHPAFFEEEPQEWALDFTAPNGPMPVRAYGGPRPVGVILPFLARRLDVDEVSVRNALCEAVMMALGTEFRWHDSVEALHRDTEPDENYGGRSGI